MNTSMMSEHLTGLGDNLTTVIGYAGTLAQETPVIILGHETHFLTFLFTVRLEPALLRDGAHFGLGHFSQRKHRARELILVKREQKIRLILPLIASPA